MSSAFRSAALFLSFAFGAIGMSVGINALVKSNILKDFVRSHAPQGVTVDINTHDILSSGAVVTVGCGLLGLTSFLTLLFTLLRPHERNKRLLHSLLHFFWVLWIFASLVAYDVIARNRRAKVAAFLAGTQLPDSLVQQQEQALGVTSVYWPHEYLKLLAILPWFAFLFGGIAGTTLLHTSNDGPGDARSSHHPDESAAKPSTEKRELEDVRERS